MKKLTGTLKITLGSEGGRANFSVAFVPYVGQLNTKVVKFFDFEDVGRFLMDLKIAEEDATRWAGKARVEGIVLISPFERSDEHLRENGLLA